MKLKTTIFVFAIALFSSLAQAEGQFYFIAKPAVPGAASQSGQTGLAVYLRFDLVEGDLPADVADLQLVRQDVVANVVQAQETDIMLPWHPSEIMSVAEIEAMYREPGQQQRLMHTLTLLKEVELSEGRDFVPGNFATILRQRLINPDNSYWNFLASRQNFNIARAKLRAFLDTTVSPAREYEYTLYAIQTGTLNRETLGRARVNTGQAHQLLPVRQLTQMLSTNCDSTQDHFSVALDWLPAGVSVTDQASNNIQLAGYELYRTTQNLAADADIATLLSRDLATDAAGLTHDGRGEIPFNGLERVNHSLLMLDGDNNPQSAEYLEAQDKLQRFGMKPGDRRAYYVVGRDFADHYGETSAVIVQVPNALPPMTPWNLGKGHRQGANPGIRLSWDEVTLANYQQQFSDRVLCNPVEAANSGLLEYARSAQACNEPSVSRIDVAGYRLYRFSNFDQALGFSDSDGDGVSDQDEALTNMQCNSNLQPFGSVSYRVPLTSLTRQVGDRTRLSFLDEGDQLVQGRYYYYRLASRTADNKFSHPTRPFRVLYPDTTPPAPPTFDISYQSSQGCCSVVALDTSATKEWTFTTNSVMGYDDLSLVNVQRQLSTDPLAISQFGSHASALCTDDQAGLSDFWGTGANRFLLYPGQYAAGSPDAVPTFPLFCQVAIPDNMDICQSGAWELQVSQCQNPVPVEDGDYIEGTVTISASTGDNESCLKVYDLIAGQPTVIATSCGTPTPGVVDFTIDGGEMCGAWVEAIDSSNNHSEPAPLPCYQIDTEANPPSPPQVISLLAGATELNFRWRSPLQPISATMIEISSDQGDQDRQLLTFPANNEDPGFVYDQTAAVHALLGTRDEWCIRAMAIGKAAGNQRAERSAWSGKLCQVRRENGMNATQYMPWPAIQPLQAGAPLRVERGIDFLDGQQSEEPQNLPLLLHFGEFDNLFPDVGPPVCLEYLKVYPNDLSRHDLLAREFKCSDLGREMIDSALELPFMVYRQARAASGETGPWVQVSPLIEEIFWGRLYDKGTLAIVNTLSDPYFSMYRHQYNSAENALPWHLGFVDRYPYIQDYEYRYQVVFFDEQHAIKGWRLSDWVLASGPVN